MTADDFRTIALGLPDTVESSHMNHPDFRVRGKIFATLGYPNGEWGVVALTPDEQKQVCQKEPDVFVPVKGAWGRAGSTQVKLGLARKRSVRAALRTAWQNHLPKEDPTEDPTAGRKPTRKAGARQGGAGPAGKRGTR